MLPASVPTVPELPGLVTQPAIASWTQPFAVSQRSCVHLSPSSQFPQAVHDVAPAAELVPGSHLVQVVEPATLLNEPAGQAVHVAFAVVVHAAAWNVPASQTLHAWHAPPLT